MSVRMLALLVVMLCALAGCGESSDKKKDDKLAEVISKETNLDKGTAMEGLQHLDEDVEATDLPRGWVPARAGMWAGPAKDGFAPNVNVLSGPAEDGVSTEDIMLHSKGQFDSLVDDPDDLEILGEDEVSVYGTDGHQLEYRLKAKNVEVHGLQYYLEIDGKNYIITGTAGASNWDEQRDDIVQVMESFDLED
jgi:hypothetical protein